MVTAFMLAGVIMLQPAPADSAVAALRQAVPQSGAIEVIYLRGEYPAQTRIGFDFATGAYFTVAQGGYEGCDASGQWYMYSDTDRALQRAPGATPDMAYRITSHLPVVMGWLLVRHPQWITSASATDGGFTLRVQPTSEISPHEVEVDIDRQGRVTRIRRDGGRPEWDRFFEFDPRAPAALGVPASLPSSGESLLSFSTLERAGDTFSSDRVAAVASQFRADVARHHALRAAAGLTADAQAGRGDDASPPVPGEGYRWPLLLTGLALVVAGAIAAWLKRRGT
jgi:hypothetical protein